MKLPPMWKPDKCLMNHNTWVLFEGYKRLTSKGDSQCDPDLSNLEGCFFLPSSWCQRSPSEKVETFLHIFSDIGEQLLSAESEMGIGILNIIEIFFQHHWNICWTSLKYEFVCSRIDLISIWIIHQPNRIWFWHSSSLQEDPLLVTAKRKYDSNYSNTNLGF